MFLDPIMAPVIGDLMQALWKVPGRGCRRALKGVANMGHSF